MDSYLWRLFERSRTKPVRQIEVGDRTIELREFGSILNPPVAPKNRWELRERDREWHFEELSYCLVGITPPEAKRQLTMGNSAR